MARKLLSATILGAALAAAAYLVAPFVGERPLLVALGLGTGAGLLCLALAPAAPPPSPVEAKEGGAPVDGGSSTQERRILRTARLAALGEVLGTICHELNNPLGVILMKTRNLLDQAGEEGLSAGAQRELERIAHHGARMRELTAGLLRYSRDDGRGDQVVDLGHVAREAVELLAPVARETGAACRVALQPEAPAVRGDAGELTQLAVNLAGNALRAASRQVELRVEAGPGGEALLVVADDGPGVAAEAVERIFDPFYTTRPAGEGTGLGLYVCACIARRHAARIEVGRSGLGGAEFVVAFAGIDAGREQMEGKPTAD